MFCERALAERIKSVISEIADVRVVGEEGVVGGWRDVYFMKNVCMGFNSDAGVSEDVMMACFSASVKITACANRCGVGL